MTADGIEKWAPQPWTHENGRVYDANGRHFADTSWEWNATWTLGDGKEEAERKFAEWIVAQSPEVRSKNIFEHYELYINHLGGNFSWTIKEKDAPIFSIGTSFTV